MGSKQLTKDLLDEAAFQHISVGEIICYPQIDTWHEYQGKKYVVYSSGNSLVGTQFIVNGLMQNFFSWTKDLIAAEYVVANLKSAKLVDAVVIELPPNDNIFAKLNRTMPVDNAGFMPFSVNGVEIVVASKAFKEMNEELESGQNII